MPDYVTPMIARATTHAIVATPDRVSSESSMDVLTLAAVLSSWENDDKDRHYPLGIWRDLDNVVPVVVRDGGTGAIRQMTAMTFAEARASGMPSSDLPL